MRSPRLALPVVLIVALAACAGPSPAAPAPAGGDATGVATAPAPPVSAGADTVSVLGTGQATFAQLRALILGSTASVEVEVYEFGRRDLVDAVIAVQRRGVRVQVIADQSEMASATTALRLRAAGVDVCDYPVRARMIDHVKLLVVDDAVAVVGGINWGSGSFANHDFDAVVTGPAAHNLDRVFQRDLVTCGRAVTVPDARFDPAVMVAATLPGREILPMVLGVLAAARDTLDVAMYTLTDSTVVAAMETAQQRGVHVRVLLDPNERPSDPSAASLRAHGVAVELYRSAGEKLHAKAAIADGSTVVFGSANWTVSGFGHNHELDVEIPAQPAIAAQFERQFEADWRASA